MSRYIDEHRARFGVEPICRTLARASASAYYQRATGERLACSVEDERLLAVIRTTHKNNYRAYGYRRMWKQLKRVGETAPRCRVQRLMAEHGIVGAKRRGRPWRTTKPDPAAVRPRDLVKRDFAASAPNRLWVSAISLICAAGGHCLLQLRDRCVLADDRGLAAGSEHAHHARARRAPDGVGADESLGHFELVHMDAGSQYNVRPLTRRCSTITGCWPRSGRSADAYDNALAESFVDSYKTELIADRVWRSRSQLELATVEYIGWFNHQRLHESLGDIPPVEFEQLHAANSPIPGDRSVAALSPSAAESLTTRRLEPVGAEIAVDGPLDPYHATRVRAVLAKTAPKVVVQRALPAGLSDE